MKYIVSKQATAYRQMTLEELLFGREKPTVISSDKTATRTYATEWINTKLVDAIDVGKMINTLRSFNEKYQGLFENDRENLYDTFYIPKKSGGLRRIDAPQEELMVALRELRDIFEYDFNALYHTSAFAYVKGRSTIDAVKKHQKNKSKWFAKLDLHNFFGSTTKEFVVSQFSTVFPFSEVISRQDGKVEFLKAIDLAFLNGGLPQGTPISPLITNVMMIPIDFALANWFRKNEFVYTRYADDFIISSRNTFNVSNVEEMVVSVLNRFNAPFEINKEKTRYGSSSGANWNLGVMLNKDNEITIGYKNKRRFKSMLFNYIADKKGGVNWEKNDVQVLSGYYSYYRMVEKTAIDNIIGFVNQKNGVDVLSMLHEDIRAV